MSRRLFSRVVFSPSLCWGCACALDDDDDALRCIIGRPSCPLDALAPHQDQMTQSWPLLSGRVATEAAAAALSEEIGKIIPLLSSNNFSHHFHHDPGGQIIEWERPSTFWPVLTGNGCQSVLWMKDFLEKFYSYTLYLFLWSISYHEVGESGGQCVGSSLMHTYRTFGKSNFQALICNLASKKNFLWNMLTMAGGVIISESKTAVYFTKHPVHIFLSIIRLEMFPLFLLSHIFV